MRPRKYPLNEMVVGDSFVAPADRFYVSECSAMVAAHMFGRRTGRKFIGRKLGEKKVRIWRVK